MKRRSTKSAKMSVRREFISPKPRDNAFYAKAKRGAPEEEIHIAIAAYLDEVLDTEMCPWTTFPAGGGGPIRGGKLKKMGLKRGWADIQIALTNGLFLFIEVKAADGRLSEDQRTLSVKLKALGHSYFVVRSVSEVIKIVQLHARDNRLILKGIPHGQTS